MKNSSHIGCLPQRSGMWMKAFILAFVCAAAGLAASAQSFRTLANFDGTNGENPRYVSLVQGLDGNFYGTTGIGGAYGLGIVFKVTPGGTLTTIYSFCSEPKCPDGWEPFAGLALGSDGNFYGTTAAGGKADVGTVFEITSQGVLTTLHSFDTSDGFLSYSPLTLGTDGNLYSTTTTGSGANYDGTIFKITLSGGLKTLHSFSGPDGTKPIGPLLQATDGNFYGTTSEGGADNAGVVFRITPDGTYTTLHSFCSLSDCADGEGPFSGVIQGTDGNLYGTTLSGGTGSCPYQDACGVVFEITLQGTLTTLHNFAGSDGAVVYSPLIQATDGNYYGVTSEGGSYGFGTAFEITPAGVLTTLRSLSAAPNGGLVQGTNGYFYGTTYEGGIYNDGTIFALSEGLGPIVESLPSYGAVGAKIRILGYNLAGTTRVTFNGTAATFTVVSGQYIKTSVPAGATTGNIQVTTANGTLTSNKRFQVLP
jgi:uncharacterized repeat protein (TIGR03803 family)